jgi:hypothetical protein
MLLCVLLGLMLSVLHLEDQFSNRRDPYAACSQQILLAAFRGPQSLDQSAAPRRLDANALPIFALGAPLSGSCTCKRRGVFMYELLENQVLGIDGWVNVSNIVFLVAFSTRDVLTLRILAFVGEGLILPYYYLQTEKLWPPILWSLAFMAVNAVRIVATVLERRPIILSDKEEQLYGIAFSSVDKREFLRLASLDRWVDYSPGEHA